MTSEASARDSVRHRQVGAAATVLAVVLMAWDHLWGNQPGPREPFPVDPGAFALSVALVVATLLLVFGFTVPRALRRPASLHRSALLHGVVALVLALPASWLGFPLVVAGGAVALGVEALRGPHRAVAMAAIALGVLVAVVAVLVTAFPPADPD